MTLNETVRDFVAGHPGVTSTEIGKELGRSAAAHCATMAAHGLLSREKDERGVWQYFPASQPSSVGDEKP